MKKTELEELCKEYSDTDCYFCPANSTCPKSEFLYDEKERPESKLFPFMEERIYGRELVFK